MPLQHASAQTASSPHPQPVQARGVADTSPRYSRDRAGATRRWKLNNSFHDDDKQQAGLALDREPNAVATLCLAKATAEPPPGRRSAPTAPPRTGRQVPHGRQRIYVVRPTRCRPVMEFEACAKSSSGSYSGVLVDEVFSGMNERTDILVAGLRWVGTIFLRHPANIADAVSSSGAGTFGDICACRFIGSLI